MAVSRNPGLMVAQGDEQASLSLIMEMLRGLGESISSQNAATAADRKLLHEMHIRIVQIESNQLQRKVEELQQKVDNLESDRDKRLGMVGAAEWLSRFGPWLIALFATIAAVVGWDRASG